jgi:hypothetical protein
MAGGRAVIRSFAGAPADLEVAPTAATSPDHLASVSVVIRYRVRRFLGTFVN